MANKYLVAIPLKIEVGDNSDTASRVDKSLLCNEVQVHTSCHAKEQSLSISEVRKLLWFATFKRG